MTEPPPSGAAERARAEKAKVLEQVFAATVGLHSAGRLGDAEIVYRRLLEEAPDHVGALHLLGVLLVQTGRTADGLASIDRALALAPDFVDALVNRAGARLELGRFEAAADDCTRALRLAPRQVQALVNRANAFLALHRPEAALADCDAALAIAPNDADALSNRSVALRDLGRPAEALADCNAALAVAPDHVDARANRGAALRALGRDGEAMADWERVLALRPDHLAALINLGTALRMADRLDEAAARFEAALRIAPNSVAALVGRGSTLLDRGRHREAREAYDAAVAIAPENSDARFDRAIVELALGDFAAGWADYEHRWTRTDAPRKRFRSDLPTWRGEDLAGRRLIVFDEQGFGDVLQFARYLPLLRDRGAEVTFLCRRSMHGILAGLGAGITLVDAVPDDRQFDVQCALMSLPLGFSTTEATIPPPVPLVAEAERVGRWRARLGPAPVTIGVCGQGNPVGAIDRGRSIPLAAFAGLAAIPGVRFVSLQKSLAPEDTLDGRILRFDGEVDAGPDAFVDTAAILASVDLVVTSDTSIAHLAGSLGRPTFVALKHVADWRWSTERADCPWYPTMRLFRQPTPGDWGAVFAEIERAVRERVATA